MITATLSGDALIEIRLKELSDEMRSGVSKAIFKLTIELQRIVQQEKLSGQVLKTRTSNLRNSITHQFTDNGNSIDGVVGTSVKSIPYARIHEFGGVIEAKKAKFLRFKIGDHWIMKKSVVIPKRSYLRSALSDLEPKVKDAIMEELRGMAL